ncbi:MrpH family fimbial adhesin [Serratia ureilytica]|uniref:MrpH family fimbial adhesin n=1 Tax=Serratia ureilytica TaxID=300181 RepID=UPI001C0F5D32|nr:hypothetical protein [Serratia ureilytica]MBU5412422.1 hypothetical protein [Serratia ureilytica]
MNRLSSLCWFFVFVCGSAYANVEIHVLDYCQRCVGIGANIRDKMTYQVVYWDTTSTAYNPCYGKSSCRIGVGFQPGNGEPTSGVLAGTDSLVAYIHGIEKVQTMGEVAKIYSNYFQLGSTQTSEGSGFGNKKLCYAMKWSIGNGPVNLVSGAYCSYTDPGPPLNTCYIDGPITIDHGTVNTGSDSTRTVTSTVSCLERTQVRLRFLGLTNDRLSLGSGGITTKLSLNGDSGTQGTLVNVEKARNTEFQIESYIESIPDGNTGLKQGSAMLILEFP